MLGTDGLDACYSCWLGQVGGGQRVFDMCTKALKVMIYPVYTGSMLVKLIWNVERLQAL